MRACLASPCQAVIASDIRSGIATARWPRFTAAALEMGYAGVHRLTELCRDVILGTARITGGKRA